MFVDVPGEDPRQAERDQDDANLDDTERWYLDPDVIETRARMHKPLFEDPTEQWFSEQM